MPTRLLVARREVVASYVLALIKENAISFAREPICQLSRIFTTVSLSMGNEVVITINEVPSEAHESVQQT